MIKRFEEYIKEAVGFKLNFKYLDNFQAIIDSWSSTNDFYITNNSNVVIVHISLPQNIDELISVNIQISELLSDLKVTLDSLQTYNIFYSLEARGTNSHSFEILITLFTEFSFRITNKYMNDLGYDVKYYGKKYKDSAYNEQDEGTASEYKYVRLKIELEHNETDDFNHKDSLNKLIEPALSVYNITKSDYEDNTRWNYIIELEKK